MQLLTTLLPILKRATLTLLCISSSLLSSRAQLISRGYIEIPTAKSDNEFTVIPAKDKGILLLKKEKVTKQKKITWRIITVDTNLKTHDIGTFNVDYEYELVGYETVNNHAFFLFHQSKFSIGYFQLFKFNFSNNELTQFNIKYEGVIKLTNFLVVNQSALFGGYIAERPVVLIYYMGAPNKLVALSGFFNNNAKLLDMRVNTNNTFNTIMIEKNSFQQQRLVTKIFSEWGDLLLQDSLYIDNKVLLTSGFISNLHRDDMMILGTYSLLSNNTATGLYAAPVNPKKKQRIKYYPFSMFNHFLDYMGPQKAEKVKLKDDKRMQLGKKPSYSAHLQPIKATETKAGFLLFANMMNSTYTSKGGSATRVTTYPPSMYGPYTTFYTPQRYSGRYLNSSYNTGSYSKPKYVQAMLALFDNTGKLVWDQTIDMSQIEYNKQVQPCNYIMGKNNDMVMVCKEDNKLLTNTITSSTWMLDTLKIPTTDTLDVVLREYKDNTGVKVWYDNYLYVWGYREVRHKATPKNNDHVFYISKFEAY